MTGGDIALTSLPQADGSTKIRPVLLLKRFPPFGDFLVCGVSSQVHQEVTGFDYVITAGSSEFASSGLKVTRKEVTLLLEGEKGGVAVHLSTKADGYHNGIVVNYQQVDGIWKEAGESYFWWD